MSDQPQSNFDLLTNKQKRFVSALVKYKDFNLVAGALRCSKRQVYRYAQNVKKRIHKNASRDGVLP